MCDCVDVRVWVCGVGGCRMVWVECSVSVVYVRVPERECVGCVYVCVSVFLRAHEGAAKLRTDIILSQPPQQLEHKFLVV